MPKAHRYPRSWPVGVVDDPIIDETNPDAEPEDAHVRSVRPPVKASKAEWVAYAETIGVDSTGSKKAIQRRVGES